MTEIELELKLEQAPKIKPTGATGMGWLVLAASFWGTVGVASGLVQRIEPTPSLMVGFLRMAFASAFLLLLARFTGRLALASLTRQEWFLFGLMGLAMAVYQLCYFAAIALSSVTLVVVVALCSSPIIVALLSIPLFKERLTGRILLALGLALSGTGLLAFGGSAVIKADYLWGALLALGCGLAYSCFTIFSKLATAYSQRSPLQMVAVAFSLSAIILLPVAGISGSLTLDLLPAVWGLIFYLGVVPTGLAYIIFLQGLKKASATAAAITSLLEPAIAAFLAWLLLGESLTRFSLVGALLLLGSVGLLTCKGDSSQLQKG